MKRPNEFIACYSMNSPLGELILSTTERGLCRIDFAQEGDFLAEMSPDHRHLEQARRELSEYFAGKRRDFQVPLDPQGTAFQLAVWKNVRKIPFGQTRSYAQVATGVGNPKAMRAVGGANGRNGLPIIVPCHRVIQHDGTLGGYSGERWRKIWLLRHEGVSWEGVEVDLIREDDQITSAAVSFLLPVGA